MLVLWTALAYVHCTLVGVKSRRIVGAIGGIGRGFTCAKLGVVLRTQVRASPVGLDLVLGNMHWIVVMYSLEHRHGKQ